MNQGYATLHSEPCTTLHRHLYHPEWSSPSLIFSSADIIGLEWTKRSELYWMFYLNGFKCKPLVRLIQSYYNVLMMHVQICVQFLEVLRLHVATARLW